MMANPNNQTYKVKLEYFNAETWIENRIFIGICASQSHCGPLPTPIITAQEYNFVTYDRR